MSWTIGEVARVAGGAVVGGPSERTVRGFAIDSRALAPGDCFVALQGNRDGHDFAADAFNAGAVAAVVARVPTDATLPPDAAFVVVADPLAALGALGRHARHRLRADVVAITGSVGKTGTKDLALAALGADRPVHASPGSFNNESGLPLTLLSTPRAAAAVVVEMGARFAGDITHLCEIARPDVGVITNIGLAHAEHLGGADRTAAVKGELLDALTPDGIAVLNADDDFVQAHRARTRARVLTAGTHPAADVRIVEHDLDDDLRVSLRLDTPWGPVAARLQLVGAHHVHNAALAATVALALGVTPEQVSAGLAATVPGTRRMQLHRTERGLTVLDDCYNANPTSMDAALAALARLSVPGRKVAVLGSMLELGDHSAAEHERVGRAAAEVADLVVVVGDEAGALARGAGELDGATGTAVRAVADAEAAAVLLARSCEPGDAVLVKASRAVALERVVEALQ